MVVQYAVQNDVLNLAGNPKEFEFPIAQVQVIMANADKIVNDFLPRVYTSSEEGYATVVRYANYIAAIEIRKQWFDAGKKIPTMLKEIEDMKAEIAAGFPEDNNSGSNLVFSEPAEIDYIYMNPYVFGGSKRGW